MNGNVRLAWRDIKVHEPRRLADVRRSHQKLGKELDAHNEELQQLRRLAARVHDAEAKLVQAQAESRRLEQENARHQARCKGGQRRLASCCMQREIWRRYDRTKNAFTMGPIHINLK